MLDSSVMPTTQPSHPITPSDVGSKGELFRKLNQDVPLNEYHLPDYLLRADLIPLDILTYAPKDRTNIIQAATMRVTFDHGYPALEGSAPMWDRLPCEGHDAFNAFMTFLELPESSNHDNPIRLLPLIAQVTKIDLSQIVNYCHMFYWHWRSRAYDLFLVAAHRKQREQRIMSIEGKHFRMAESALDKIIRIADHRLDTIINSMGTDEDTDDTKLKDLVDIADRLVKIQRISVGLSAAGVSQIDVKDTTPRHATVEDTFKAVSKTASGDASPTRRSTSMDQLLHNPEDLATIQDLIVRMSSNHKLIQSPQSQSDNIPSTAVVQDAVAFQRADEIRETVRNKVMTDPTFNNVGAVIPSQTVVRQFDHSHQQIIDIDVVDETVDEA